MIRTKRLHAAIAAAALLVPGAGIAQQAEDPALYLSVDCVKSTSNDYERLGKETWLPVHEELVRAGRKNSWALYSVLFGDRSRCDYYEVTTYLGEEQLNAEPRLAEAFEAAHDDIDLTEAMARAGLSRERVATELWMRVDGTGIRAHKYVDVNLMHAADPDAYERIESRVFKAGHQALVDGGHRAGWAVYELISPLGTSIPYNYVTVDFLTHLGPVPMAEAMLAAHPDRDLDEMHDLLERREEVLSETWALVAATERAAAASDGQ